MTTNDTIYISLRICDVSQTFQSSSHYLEIFENLLASAALRGKIEGMPPEPVDHVMQNSTKTVIKHPKMLDGETQSGETKKVSINTDDYQKKTSYEILPKIQEAMCMGNRTRHIILLIGTLCMTMLLSNILILTVTMACMTGSVRKAEATFFEIEPSSASADLNDNESDADVDRKSIEPEFNWSSGEKSLIFSSGTVGALSCTPVAVFLLRRIGARRTFALAGMLSASATALTPFAVHGGVPTFVLARFMQGAGLSSLLPVIGGVSAGWSTLKYSGLFLSMITGFIQLAPMFTIPVAGIICTSEIGWPMVYYIHASLTVIFFTMWAVFFKDSPQAHRWTSQVEISKITAGKPPMLASPTSVPYLAILTSPTIWAIWLTAFVNFAGMDLFIIYMPNFICNSLGYSFKDACLLAAMPPLAQFFAKIVAGILGDREYSYLSGTSKVRIFNSVASIGAGFFLLALAFIPPTERFWSLVLLTISASLLGFNTSGLFRSPSLVACQHTHFIMIIIQVLLCVCLLGMPFVVDLLTPVKPAKDWSRVFGAIAFLLLITNVVFCVFAKGSPAPWAVMEEQNPVKVHPIDNGSSPSAITITN